jgi:hypothetical protein
MQLVDPVKGAIKGEVIVPSSHADYITAIDMDPIGKLLMSVADKTSPFEILNVLLPQALPRVKEV